MIKRLILIVLLGLSLVGLSRTEASAQACEPTLLSFYGICVVMDLSDFSVEAGSVDVSTILKKLQNSSVTKPALETVALLQQVILRCLGGGQQPLDVLISVTDTQAIDASKVAKNGRFLADSLFTDDEIRQALAAAGVNLNVCPKGQNAELIAVTKLQVIGTLFTCEFGGEPSGPRETGCVIADSLGKQCTAPAGQDPFATPFTYSCSTVCQGVPDPTIIDNPATDDCKQPVVGNQFYPTS